MANLLKKIDHWLMVLSAFMYTKTIFGADPVEIKIGEATDLEDITFIDKIQTLGIGVLIYALGPIAGSYTIYEGIKAFKGTSRGSEERNQAMVMVAVGAALFALGPIISQIVTYLKD
ncbi:MAG: hypothetical protein HRT70_08675 [Flavobacteriaceae bacterium]|nr:hypothetical protein [Flavobacteriaceae bacterium]